MKHFSLLCMVLLLVSCSMTLPKTEKINGVSFVASRDSISEKHTKPVLNLNANYAAIMPFGFVKSLEHPEKSANLIQADLPAAIYYACQF